MVGFARGKHVQLVSEQLYVQEEDDGQMPVGEQGEEEVLEDDAELPDNEVEGSVMSGWSRTVAGNVGGEATLSLGSLGAHVSEPKKKRAAPKAASKQSLEQGISLDVACGEKGGDTEHIKGDPVLRMMVDDLGYVPPCFAGLMPEEALVRKRSLGRQVRGASCCEKAG